MKSFSRTGCLVLLLFALVNCRDKKTEQEQVVMYTSLDKVFSEPVLEAFEKETGTKVLDVYDSEATKTTGLSGERACRVGAEEILDIQMTFYEIILRDAIDKKEAGKPYRQF